MGRHPRRADQFVVDTCRLSPAMQTAHPASLVPKPEAPQLVRSPGAQRSALAYVYAGRHSVGSAATPKMAGEPPRVQLSRINPENWT